MIGRKSKRPTDNPGTLLLRLVQCLLEESWIDFDVGIVSKAGNREYWLEETGPMLMGNDLDEPETQ